MAKRGYLSSILYLQMDNCARENKNWMMFAYLSWLVEKGIFKKVCVGFLIVGYVYLDRHYVCWVPALTHLTQPVHRRHTHCSCDQCFSCHSRHLRRNNAKTIAALMEQLRRSYTYAGERPEVFELKESADIKAWLEPCVYSCKNITAAHQYTIEAKEIDGVTNAVTRVKQYARCSDEKWMTAGVLLQV